MTQILNNMKRKEKKGLFYLIGIAIMVAIMGISCSAKATAPADFSETEDFVEAPAPEVKPEQPVDKEEIPSIPEEKPSVPEVKPEQTPTAPEFKIKDWDPASQFEGLTFANENLTVKIETRKNPAVSDPYAKVTWGVSLTGVEYQFHANKGASKYNITHNGKNGNALFTKDGKDGYLKIWFENNQSDLITLKLVK